MNQVELRLLTVRLTARQEDLLRQQEASKKTLAALADEELRCAEGVARLPDSTLCAEKLRDASVALRSAVEREVQIEKDLAENAYQRRNGGSVKVPN